MVQRTANVHVVDLEAFLLLADATLLVGAQPCRVHLTRLEKNAEAQLVGLELDAPVSGHLSRVNQRLNKALTNLTVHG